MRTIVGNTVKTDFGDYSFPNREQAEALFMSLHLRERERRRERRAASAQSRATRSDPDEVTRH